MHLALLDWILLVGFLLLVIGLGLSYTRSSGRNLQAFFLGGRNLPWYLAGVSMVATTFAADTPLAVADLTGTSGVSGNWLWWNMLFGGLLTTFFFARLWRRANVLTEVEFIELRYAGRMAAFLRGFKAVYLGVFLNVLVIGWVSQAMATILAVFLGVTEQHALWITFGLMAFTAGYSALAGLKGIAVTDALQFLLAMGGTLALALLVVRSPQIGGLSGLQASVPEGALDLFPSIQTSASEASGRAAPVGTVLSIGLGAFLARVGMQWWASWYPGAEPGGGGYVAQRMMATRTERDSVWATLFFNAAHYCLRPWPWVLVGLAAMVLYAVEPNLPADDLGRHARLLIADGADPSWFALSGEALIQVVEADPATARLLPEIQAVATDLQARGAEDEALGQALAYAGNKQLGYVYAMKDFLPVGLRGLLLAAFVAAFMSTISTQLNWGASYVVNDLIGRFGQGGHNAYEQDSTPDVGPVTLDHVLPAASVPAAENPVRERRLVWTARWVTLGLMLLGVGVASVFESITAIWVFLIECGAGLGLVLILRWYWWRINAAAELAATLGSIGIFGAVQVWNAVHPGSALAVFPNGFLVIVIGTTVLWLLVMLLTQPEPNGHLQAFVRRVRPAGAWSAVYRDAGITVPQGKLGWLALAWASAVAMVYSVLFASGAFLLGTGGAWGWTFAAIAAGGTLVAVVRSQRLFDEG